MGQTWMKRLHFKAREECTNPQNSAQQEVALTCFFEIGDVVDVVDVDVNGNVTAVLADNLTVLGKVVDQEISLSAVVDTTAAVGTPMIINQTIDDGQAALERAFCRPIVPGESQFVLTQAILDKSLNDPSAGKTKYDIADSSFWRAGDLTDIYDDDGLVGSDFVIDSVNINADDTLNKATIVINSVQDVDLLKNPFLLNKTITVQKAVLRNQERIDEIDRPTKNDYWGVGDGALTCFKTSNLFVAQSSDLFFDGRKQTLGLAGTRATLTQDTGNAQLIYTSMILGLLGNEVEVEVQAGAGFTITVVKDFKVSGSGSFTNAQYLIQINDNGGAATSQEIADALNADAEVQRIIQVQYGGDGTGVPAVFGPTNLAGGLDDGTGDYAEVEQIFENAIATTGFKYMSWHIRPNERNRMPEPPADDEDIIFGYARAHDNVDR
jgi:hypothetical protein